MRKSDWGVLRVRWKPDASWKYFRFLKQVVAYLSAATFFTDVFIIPLCFFYGHIIVSYHEWEKILSLIMGGDYSKRLDSQSYSKGLSENCYLSKPDFNGC